jgi:hypothetical protein
MTFLLKPKLPTSEVFFLVIETAALGSNLETSIGSTF